MAVDPFGVAFTPKGGCPLKQDHHIGLGIRVHEVRSIHPQGWVPVETVLEVGAVKVHDPCR